MKHAYKNLRDCVFHSPLGLVNLDPKMEKIASDYLPFSTGIEIECSVKSEFESCSAQNSISMKMNRIDSIMGFRIQDSFQEEIDFRIPNGIKGLKCLDEICTNLKRYFELNPASGIHYHVDFTKYYNDLSFRWGREMRETAEKLFLTELDSWGYKGTYNDREVSTIKGGWVRICSNYKTIEFRIGEMSFDYSVLVKRIIHCNYLVKRFIRELQLKEII